MKNLFRNIINRIKKWNAYWTFIEKERIKAMIYSGRASF